MASLPQSPPNRTWDFGLDTPALARARQLYGCVIKGGKHLASTPSGIADRVEQRISLTSAMVGGVTESGLALEFSTGRRVARQASRILQLRGIMTPKRGGNGVGGLWMMPATLETLTAALDVEADLIGPRSAVLEAQRLLMPVAGGRQDALEIFVQTVLNRADACSSGTSRAGDVRRRGCGQAQRLAEQLEDALAAKPPGDRYLGSIADIADRFGVSSDVAVEAVRMLGDAQRVEVRRGRDGGVYGCDALPTRALHVANMFLSSNAITIDACRQVLDRLNTAMIEIARERPTAEGLARAEGSFHAMRHAPDASALGRCWYDFIRDVADMAANPVLHFLARALAGTILMRRTREADLPDSSARELLAASRDILDHLHDGPAVRVAEAQSRCQQALENYW